jgi:hypothetical protein
MSDFPGQVSTGAPVAPAGQQPSSSFCNKKNARMIIKVMTILCVVAAGLFSCNQMMYYSGDGAIRWHLIYFYTTFLSIFVITAEIDLLRHRSFRNFIGFLTNNTGRGVCLLFMGGTMLLNQTAGLIVGICLFVAGFMNLFSWCFFPELRGDDEKFQQQQLEEQKRAAAAAEQRTRI